MPTLPRVMHCHFCKEALGKIIRLNGDSEFAYFCGKCREDYIVKVAATGSAPAHRPCHIILLDPKVLEEQK